MPRPCTARSKICSRPSATRNCARVLAAAEPGLSTGASIPRVPARPPTSGGGPPQRSAQAPGSRRQPAPHRRGPPVSARPLFLPPDGHPRCPWCAASPGDALYLRYHDEGASGGRRGPLVRKLCLEGFQSGLSWRTILHKREGFRRAFEGFDVHRLARWGGPSATLATGQKASCGIAARSRRP